MAKKEVEVEIAQKEASSSGPSMKMLIIVLVVVQLVMFGGLAAFLMASGVFSQHASTPEGEAAPAVEEKESIYITFDPAFTVNFGGASSSRFMQVTIEAMSHDPNVVEQVRKHMPVIRNSIVLLLSSQTVEGVSTLEGKEKLRKQILVEIQNILKQRTGSTGIEEIYFTSFVMQ